MQLGRALLVVATRRQQAGKSYRSPGESDSPKIGAGLLPVRLCVTAASG